MMKSTTIYIFCCLIFSLTAFSQTVTDAQGLKQGYWKKKDEKSGKLIYEGFFKDNKPQGIFKYYYPFDTIKAIMNFKDDGKIAYSTMFHPNGKKMAYGKYIGENKDSVWTYYDETMVLISKESYVNGKKHGMEYVYFPDGVISEERSYKNGEQDGPYKLYYEKDLIKTEGSYSKGKIDGKNAYYFPNKVTAAVGYYKNGVKVGPWIYREKDGKVKEKELFKQNGQQASKKETDEFFSKNKTTDEKPIDSSSQKAPQKTNTNKTPQKSTNDKAVQTKPKATK
ncbi:MAG: hypothetical protein IT237_02600 [Bacteroidia bacterium]|nr:hypothetical protein [Bacteroidia bacterium]